MDYESLYEIQYITSLPPQINVNYCRTLLSDYEEVRRTMCEYYNKKVKKKHKNNPGILKEAQNLTYIYEALYGWIKAETAFKHTKEKERQEAPAIPYEVLDKIPGRLGKALRVIFLAYAHKRGQNNAIP